MLKIVSQNIYQKSLLKCSWPTVTQVAGHRRKPRWLPVAKSKIYRIPKRPVVPDDERLELLRINANYKTKMRAVRSFFVNELLRENELREKTKLSDEAQEEIWNSSMKLNDEWNAKVALERQERRKQELAAMEGYILKRIETKDITLKKRISKASQEIRVQKELASQFIKQEDVEKVIDYALANPVDYNYAIDLQGNRYMGRDTPIATPKHIKDTISVENVDSVETIGNKPNNC